MLRFNFKIKKDFKHIKTRTKTSIDTREREKEREGEIERETPCRKHTVVTETHSGDRETYYKKL